MEQLTNLMREGHSKIPQNEKKIQVSTQDIFRTASSFQGVQNNSVIKVFSIIII